ncbi:uncharacterized protein LOC131955285 [Physella acuta]|uniref:uncharacterized protein LOC131955285 n=1 Tax=Physella acuta TaxID=109671 RepID=UPI0027DCAB99|nr:uncharacterized protein LOC131955285 [Physella acuta]
MACSLSHGAILEKNIRQVYSGSHAGYQLREGREGGVIDIHDRVLEKHRRPRDRFNWKFEEYVTDYKIRIPRAPSFRCVSAREAREISDRLYRRHESANQMTGTSAPTNQMTGSGVLTNQMTGSGAPTNQITGTDAATNQMIGTGALIKENRFEIPEPANNERQEEQRLNSVGSGSNPSHGDGIVNKMGVKSQVKASKATRRSQETCSRDQLDTTQMKDSEESSNKTSIVEKINPTKRYSTQAHDTDSAKCCPQVKSGDITKNNKLSCTKGNNQENHIATREKNRRIGLTHNGDVNGVADDIGDDNRDDDSLVYPLLKRILNESGGFKGCGGFKGSGGFRESGGFKGSGGFRESGGYRGSGGYRHPQHDDIAPDKSAEIRWSRGYRHPQYGYVAPNKDEKNHEGGGSHVTDLDTPRLHEMNILRELVGSKQVRGQHRLAVADRPRVQVSPYSASHVTADLHHTSSPRGKKKPEVASRGTSSKHGHTQQALPPKCFKNVQQERQYKRYLKSLKKISRSVEYCTVANGNQKTSKRSHEFPVGRDKLLERRSSATSSELSSGSSHSR